jgi:dihydrofolate reductase
LEYLAIIRKDMVMRKIVAGLLVSLDGVAESPEKWTFPFFNDEVGQVIQSQMDASDAMLLGRRTYEEWAAYWPDKTAQDDPFADYINNAPKFVVSTTLKSVEWRNSTLITGDVAEELAKLKWQPGKDITISGSITLVGSLLRNRLLDELSLLLHPVVVGTGRRLFEDPAGHVPLKLMGSRVLSNGVLSLTYEPAGT